jgi:hypothetical protein
MRDLIREVIQDDKGGSVREYCIHELKSFAGPPRGKEKKKQNRTLLARAPIRLVAILLHLRQVDIPRHTILRAIPRHRRRRARLRRLRRRRLRLLLLIAP